MTHPTVLLVPQYVVGAFGTIGSCSNAVCRSRETGHVHTHIHDACASTCRPICTCRPCSDTVYATLECRGVEGDP